MCSFLRSCLDDFSFCLSISNFAESEKLFVSIGFWEDPVDPILLGSDLGL